MLKWRLILGTLFIAVLVGLCWLDFWAPRPGMYLLPLAVLLSLVGAGELLTIFRQQGYQPLPWVIYAGVLLAVLSAGLPVLVPGWNTGDTIGRLGWLVIAVAVALLIAIVGELIRYESPVTQGSARVVGSHHTATTNLALSAFATVYAGGLMGFLVQLRLLDGPQWGSDGRWGMVALLSLVATVKVSDIGQYAAGRLFGSRKLAPSVSPGKTWEGALGGVAFAVVAAWLVLHWATAIATPKSASRLVATIAFAVMVAAAGMIGDLAESMLKRDAGLKDSSTWMPGFGGVLDLLDSLLGAAPVAYLFWVLGIVGP